MKRALLLLSLLAPGLAKADGPYHLLLQIPLYDSDGGQVSGFSPSLYQAQALTTDYYLGTHWLLAKAFGTETQERPHPLENFALIALDWASMYMPLGSTWLHEEAHRSVFNRYGIKSHNGVYDAGWGDDDVPVDRVRDADLSRLKRKHPADFVRMSTAGMEAESQLALNLEKAQMFDRALPRQRFTILLAHLSPIFYRSFCDSRDGDAATREDLQTEGPDEMARDFTGYDCVAYVYDLFRPYEAYEARGPHPSGNGIARYRSRDDLTESEKRYLHRMVLYGYLNLLDPFLFYPSGWRTSAGDRWAVTMRHHLAPFGHSFEQNLFWAGDNANALIIFRQYVNKSMVLPGLEWQQEENHIQFRVALWAQPKSLLFATRAVQAGGSFAIHTPVSRSIDWLFTELLVKSRGWLPDEASLAPATIFRLGVNWKIN